MLQESHERSDRLKQAAAALRDTPIRPEALDAAETAIVSRVRPTPYRSPRYVWAWGTGISLAACALIAAILAAPSPVSAAEVIKIVQNADRALRHVQTYKVLPDGSQKLLWETYSDGTRSYFRDDSGRQAGYVNGRQTILNPDGTATIENQTQPTAIHPDQMFAKDLVAFQSRGHDAKVRTERDVVWQQRRVDRYTLDCEFVDSRGHYHAVLIADPQTERPLEMDCNDGSAGTWVVKWGYPAADPGLWRLPITPRTRVYDIDAERASVEGALLQPGRVVEVGGQRVELIQLWVDDSGAACAVARADYAYPYNYGIHIDGMKTWTEAEEEPFSGRWVIIKPNSYNGQPVQLFFTSRWPNAGKLVYRDSVLLEIPVFKDKKLVGYARFDDVPVHRAWRVYDLLRPYNVPFWEKSPVATPTGKG